VFGYPMVTVLGIIGFVVGAAFCLMFMFYQQLGLANLTAYEVVAGILIISVVWYLAVKLAQGARGIHVDFAFKEIPPE